VRSPEAEGTVVSASELVEAALAWLQREYHGFRFFAERDVVWTLQLRLCDQIASQGLPYCVFHGFRMAPGVSADLAVLDSSSAVEVAVELKYEPSHRRHDIDQKKFPVCFWGDDGVAKDITRARSFVASGVARSAYAIFVDEGSYFRHRPPHADSEWIDWGETPGVSVLWSRFDGAGLDTQVDR
jgi:hypothetical protein